MTRVTLLQDHLSSKSIFHWCLLIGMVIPFILLCIYSYSSDMQAQGRYILPMTIPFMYFVTLGYQFLLNRLVKNGRNQGNGLQCLGCGCGAVRLVGFSDSGRAGVHRMRGGSG